mmetsp:Transcript_25518/g.33099  ORF Transcript_25518/g.33099 Transcript_25518/m.33099 type:complete len:511 (-) Transcript_25518:267-1799(-)
MASINRNNLLENRPSYNEQLLSSKRRTRKLAKLYNELAQNEENIPSYTHQQYDDSFEQKQNWCIGKLSSEFVDRWPSHATERRQIGREAEYPIVDKNGLCGDARLVLYRLLEMYDSLEPIYEEMMEGQRCLSKLKGMSLEFCLEVGLGVIEMITDPCPDLHTICTVHENGLSMLRNACDSLEYRILGYGTQPISTISPELMTPKIRYHKLVEVLGDMWYSFEPTASDQAHIDVEKEELIQVLNIASLLTPVVVSLMANSPIVSGKLTPWISSREGMMGGIDVQANRHGMPRNCYRDLEDWLRQICHLDYIIKIDKTTGETCAPQFTSDQRDKTKRPFIDYLTAEKATFDDFETHEHYVWHSVRPRWRYGTVELRAACQQPHDEHMAACALSLGIVEAAGAIEKWLLLQAPLQYWFQLLHACHPFVLAHGMTFRKHLPKEEAQRLDFDFESFVGHILAFVEQALETRGLGEQIYLQPVLRRFAERKSPAQTAVEIAKRKGVRGLIRHAAQT